MKSAFFSFILFLLVLASDALGCWYQGQPTESMEPVTIKISNTFLQIPESYIGAIHQRIPREVEGIRVSFEINSKKYSLTITKYDASVKLNNYPAHAKLFDDLGYVSTTSSDVDGVAISHLQSLASAAMPANWNSDIALVEKLGPGCSPCENMTEGPPPKCDGKPSFEDIKHALDHRNQAIRARGAYFLGQLPFRKEAESKEILLLSHQEKDFQVRGTAIGSLGLIAKEDATVIPYLIDRMINDEDKRVRNSAALNIGWSGNSTDGAFVALFKPYLEIKNIERTKIMSEALKDYLVFSIRQKGIASPDQLQVPQKEAFSLIIQILEQTSDKETKVWLLHGFKSLRSVAKTPESVKVLATLLKDENEQVRSYAQEAIDALYKKSE